MKQKQLKKKVKTKKRKVGRPDKTDEIIQSHIEDIRKYCRFGLTDDQIRQLINVPKTSYYRHQQKNKDIWDSLKNEKLDADGNVIASLYKRATGFEYEEIKQEGIEKEGKITIKSITKFKKYLPPDTTAMIYWLRNRQGWIDRIDMNQGKETEEPAEFSSMTDTQLDEWIGKHIN